MEEQSTETNNPTATPDLAPFVIFALILFASVFAVYEFTKPRISAIILPGGVTYLGPANNR